MKKTIYLFISFTFLVNISKAQQSSFGITAGATFASYKAKYQSLSQTAKTKVGFTAGLTSSVPIGKNFSFKPGLNFVQKGGILKEQDFKDNTTFNYLELPLNVVFNTKAGTGSFFFGAGPSISFGLSGKDKWKGAGESQSDDIKFGSGDDDDLRAFEAGANFLAGYQFTNGLFVGANYNTGLSDVDNDNDSDSKFHNRYFGLRIGVMFGGSKSKSTEK